MSKKFEYSKDPSERRFEKMMDKLSGQDWAIIEAVERQKKGYSTIKIKQKLLHKYADDISLKRLHEKLKKFRRQKLI